MIWARKDKDNKSSRKLSSEAIGDKELTPQNKSGGLPVNGDAPTAALASKSTSSSISPTMIDFRATKTKSEETTIVSPPIASAASTSTAEVESLSPASPEPAAQSIAMPPGLTEDQVLKRLGGNVRSVLSEGTVINGRLTFDTPVKIDGKLTGEVFSTKALVVGRTGKINANIQVENLIVMGEVEGEVKASDSIEVLPGGKLSADIKTKRFIVTDAVFDGNCKMT